MLLPHIRLHLTQKKIATQDEALEIVMKLEALLIRDTHAEVKQIQSQLANLTLELQDLNKGKETISEVWCTKSNEEGHYKDQCPMIRDYLVSGALNLVKLGLWCEICRTRGQHHSKYC